MGQEEPAQAVASGPHEPPNRERPVAQEPPVVVAWGVAAFDERAREFDYTPAPMAAPVRSDLSEARAPIDTIPPERELTLAARQARTQSRLLTAAAIFLLASAGIVAKGMMDERAGRPSPGITRVREHLFPRAKAAPAAPRQAVTELSPALPVPPPPPVPSTPMTAPEAHSLAMEELQIVPPSPSAKASAAHASDPRPASSARRAKPARKSKAEIVREAPF